MTDNTTRRHWYKKRSVVVGGVIAGVLAISGAAFAYWTSTGGGTGGATTGSGVTAITVTQSGTALTGLAPGSAPQYVGFTVANPSSEAAYVTKVVATLTNVTWTSAAGTTTATPQTATDHAAGAVVPSGCTTADFVVVQPDLSNTAKSITHNFAAATNQVYAPAASTGAADLNTGVTVAMTNTGVSQDICKLTTINLAFTAS
jgi:hypothetical protein